MMHHHTPNGDNHDANGSGGVFVPLSNLSVQPERLDLDSVREKLAGKGGRQYWRSLEELADTPEFHAFLEREFPHQAPTEWEPLNRRSFMKVMGATLALAGVGGCAMQPAEKIVPYLENPEQIVPGKPLYYATCVELGGYARPVLGETHMGRPVKLEGNPDHPASRGATDAITQAAVLGLYDPDRAQQVRNNGTPATWDGFLRWLEEQLPAMRKSRGAGLRFLMGAFSSPTLEAQFRRVLARFPEARVYIHEPVSRENAYEGCRLAFGQELAPVYHVDRATTIFSLDSDFLVDEPGSVRYARDFAAGRNVREDRLEMNRLWVAEGSPSITGVAADHVIRIAPSAIEGLARAVQSALVGGSPAAPNKVEDRWFRALVADLKSAGSKGLAIAGSQQPARVHALAAAINSALGAVGSTVTYIAPPEVRFGEGSTSLKALVAEMAGGKVSTLVTIGCNPVYTATADVEFIKAVSTVKTKIHLGLYEDETAVLSDWQLPLSHPLESWGDSRAYDGVVTLMQPLIQPLYESHTASELLAVILGEGDRGGREILQEHWFVKRGGVLPRPGDGMRPDSAGKPVFSVAFEKWWHETIHQGFVPGESPAAAVGAAQAPAEGPAAEDGAATDVEILFRPDPCIWDGRFANNAWLQELPKPLTTITWDNAAHISTRKAKALGVTNGDLIEVRSGEKSVTAAAWLLPNQPDDVVTIHLGYGRTRAGKLGTGSGFNAYELRTSAEPGFSRGGSIGKGKGKFTLAVAQVYYDPMDRDFYKHGTLGQLKAEPRDPHFMHSEVHLPENLPSLFPSDFTSDAKEGVRKGPDTWEGEGYNGTTIAAWGMVIDLNACIGCNACTIACQAENNVATVGKDQVLRNREMHWIRIDHWYAGPPENADTHFQPVACMHCEKAPCEPVCPVGATTHSAEGINEMVYNRCVGTRYCQNNCPYKVRRFNYLQYSDQQNGLVQMMKNPDVTVRSRGVMEKCTFCIQRINNARIEAEKEERELRDGDIVTACQQVCPSQAIYFGNLNDRTGNDGKGSRVRQLASDPTSYKLLEELNIRPRTAYLAKLRNPHPDLDTSHSAGAAHAAPAGEHGAADSHGAEGH